MNAKKLVKKSKKHHSDTHRCTEVPSYLFGNNTIFMLSLSLKELSCLHFCKTFPLRVAMYRDVGRSESPGGGSEL